MPSKKVKAKSVSQEKKSETNQEASSNKINSQSLGNKRTKNPTSTIFSNTNGTKRDIAFPSKFKKRKLTEAMSLSGHPKTNKGTDVDLINAEVQENANKTSKNVKKSGLKKKNAGIKQPETSKTDVGADVESDQDTIAAESKEKKKKKMVSYKEKMSDDENKRTIFVGNLPVGVTREDVKKWFSPCGKIATARLRSIVPKKDKMMKKVAAIKNEISTEYKDSVNAYVKFVDENSVKNALKMNTTLFGTRRLQIDSCNTHVRYDTKRSVFVGNLPFTCKEDALYNQFSNCGEIERVRLVRNPKTGEGRGFGFVVFKDDSAAVLALKLNGDSFENRPLRVTRIIKKFNKNKPVGKNDTRTEKTIVGDRTSKSDNSKKPKMKKIKNGTKILKSRKVKSFMT